MQFDRICWPPSEVSEVLLTSQMATPLLLLVQARSLISPSLFFQHTTADMRTRLPGCHHVVHHGTKRRLYRPRRIEEKAAFVAWARSAPNCPQSTHEITSLRPPLTRPLPKSIDARASHTHQMQSSHSLLNCSFPATYTHTHTHTRQQGAPHGGPARGTPAGSFRERPART